MRKTKDGFYRIGIYVFFLPGVIFLNWMIKEEYRKYFLLFVSLMFYAFGSAEYFGLLCISLLVNIGLGYAMQHWSERVFINRIFLITRILYNLSLLAYYKYSDFIIFNINRAFGIQIFEGRQQATVLPLGISFFTFKAISYLADIYKHKVNEPVKAADAALYLSIFTQIQSGPIARYADMRLVGHSKQERRSLFEEGVWRFLQGACKKVLISNTLYEIVEVAFALDAELSVKLAWLGAVCYSLQLYYDFSGYSDMAIGICKMLGYHCPENFDYPYMTKSVSEFWRRWHITLGAWFREYVYIPLGGSRVRNKGRLVGNLLVVWLLTGLWHGASLSFVLWGLGHFLVIAFEKLSGWPQKFQSPVAKALYRVFTLLFIMFQWVMFRAGGIRNGLVYWRNMFISTNQRLGDARADFLIRDNWAFLLAAIIMCFPIWEKVQESVKENAVVKTCMEIISALLLILCFAGALSFVVAGQNNPFAYANF